jgi:hypothetical protein
MTEIPETIVACDGCGDELNVLAPYLKVMLKPERAVLVSEELPSDDPENQPGDLRLNLGTRSGRGVMLRLHDFQCLIKWADERKGLSPKIEFHREDEIYVPADNRSPEELVKAGDLPKEMLAVYAVNENTGGEK